MNSKVNFYEILGVNRDATLKEIKDAYRKKVVLYHPDNNKEMAEEECHKMMCLLNLAYSTLRDPEKREVYDETLDAHNGNSSTENSDQEPETYARSYDRYAYYNSVDYDDVIQSEFLKCLKEYIEEYINLVLVYMLKKRRDDYDILDYLYESFTEIIQYEESYFITNSKGLNL